MTEAPVTRPPWWRACLIRGLVALAVLVALFFAIGLAFDQGSSGIEDTRTYNAGEAENYQRSDVSYIAQRHLYIVRLADGSFVALYDKSPKQQEIDSNCRVRFDERAQLGSSIDQLEGFSGAFVEDCEGTRAVWRADGERAYGAGFGDLDRFDTRINDQGELIVDMQDRTCTRSRGVSGVPPFDERRCQHSE